MRLLLILLLAGCSTPIKGRDIDVATIKWVRTAPESCGKYTKADGLLACADERKFTGRMATCTIQMPENASNSVVAEEYRHCFGYEH